MDISRQHDIKVVEQGLKSADPTERRLAQNAADNIKREQGNSWERDARERLIKETVRGKHDSAAGIRDDMVRHRGGRMGKGNRGEVISACIHWPPGVYERVFGHD